jgi:L-serine dehydratase
MEECISVFDMLKIGVGPSSSHTLGPWRAAERFLEELKEEAILDDITRVKVDLYGSLSLTGKGHATDLAVMLGLSGQDPEYIPVEDIAGIIKKIETTNEINLGNQKVIPFFFLQDIVFNKDFLPFHANGLKFTAYQSDDSEYEFYRWWLCGKRRTYKCQTERGYKMCLSLSHSKRGRIIELYRY